MSAGIGCNGDTVREAYEIIEVQPIPAYMRLSVGCLFLRSPSRVPYLLFSKGNKEFLLNLRKGVRNSAR